MGRADRLLRLQISDANGAVNDLRRPSRLLDRRPRRIDAADFIDHHAGETSRCSCTSRRRRRTRRPRRPRSTRTRCTDLPPVPSAELQRGRRLRQARLAAELAAAHHGAAAPITTRSCAPVPDAALRGRPGAATSWRALAETGRLSNTFIVFISDNGLENGAHRLLNKGVPYEESIHVPLIVRYDPITNSTPRRRTRSRSTSTSLRRSPRRRRPAPGAEGTSLLPILRGRSRCAGATTS